MYKNHNGFAVIEVIVTALVMAVIGGVAFYVYQSNSEEPEEIESTQQDNGNKYTENTQLQPNKEKPVAQKSPKSPTKEIKVTPYNGSHIMVAAPSGWKLLSNDNSKLEKTIGGKKYLISFQITEQDYQKLSAYKSSGILASRTSKNGSPIYILKTHSNIELSLCKPVNGKGCSLKQNGKPLLVFVSTPGRGAPGAINFSDASSKILINDLKTIVSQSIF